ncbi:unnamed protein product [Cochlearia groenlandica]
MPNPSWSCSVSRATRRSHLCSRASLRRPVTCTDACGSLALSPHVTCTDGVSLTCQRSYCNGSLLDPSFLYLDSFDSFVTVTREHETSTSVTR